MTLERKRSLTISAYLALSFLYGAIFEIGRYYHWPDYLTLAFIIIGVVMIASWYFFDSEIMKYHRTKGMNIFVVGFALIGIPYYLFATRGRKKGMIGTGLFLALIVGTSLISWLGEWFGYGILYWKLHNAT